MNPSYLILLAFLVGFLLTARNIYRRGHPIAGVLVSAGAVGFLGCFLVPLAGSTLNYVELPSTGHGLLGPDRRIFTFTMHLSRIQRYDPHGWFEKGWFVDAAAGYGAIGLTDKGQIAFVPFRKNRAQIFATEGATVGTSRPYTKIGHDLHDLVDPEKYEIEGVNLLPETDMGRQRGGLLPALLVPFWNPIIAWLLFASGFLLYQLTRD